MLWCLYIATYVCQAIKVKKNMIGSLLLHKLSFNSVKTMKRKKKGGEKWLSKSKLRRISNLQLGKCLLQCHACNHSIFRNIFLWQHDYTPCLKQNMTTFSEKTASTLKSSILILLKRISLETFLMFYTLFYKFTLNNHWKRKQ